MSIEAKNLTDGMMTPELMQLLQDKEGIIHTMELTSTSCPEQYDCLDEYGNKVAYMRMRDHNFTVSCPDCTCTFEEYIYSNNEIQGFGSFHPDERVTQLGIAIDKVNEYYQASKMVRLIPTIPGGTTGTYVLTGSIPDAAVLEKLYKYEQSNLIPEEVMDLREKGPVVGYRDCCIKIIDLHRCYRREQIPETATGGMTEEHIEQELSWFKYTQVEFPDHIIAKMMAVNWIFHKKFEDFEKIFREFAKTPNNAIPHIE